MKHLEKVLEDLKEITINCRIDMHEPDEQEITAHVLGSHLDNSMGGVIVPELLIKNNHEIIVIIKNNNYDDNLALINNGLALYLKSCNVK